ncbi:hypothetical protein PAALTS15_00835 [Paenibacillus alvei TS-15]|uniref:Uncharacterized protein n=1 Tax=Paenibacillus alvei TS-15 TaxID=1117108 RepID=S9U3N6_PAEAL|nr:hypothetical protein [Paenibacillus alvei]EPY09161.1 hypothetical protein PAALTS15_00835 [Paenibacillus alvei TS-15]
MLRDNEGEKLFGLTPVFSSMALYSDQHRIDILKDVPFWERIFEQVNQAVHNKTMAIPETASQLTPEMLSKKLFIEGKSAMTVARQDLLYRYIANVNKFNLGLVTVPVDPAILIPPFR